jgi:glycosyltransferase involved in cell wall biosynthesis
VATPFHVIVDDALESRPRGLAAPARGLISAMLATRPAGIEVVGFVSSSPESEYAELEEAFPRLARLQKSTLAHAQLAGAWQHGFTPPLGGMVHSPSLFAPLSGRGDQTVVTVHDAIAWLDPETVAGSASWFRNMGKRADRHAAAVVVPSHATADAFAELGMFGDRMRVIPNAPTPGLVVPDDAAARRDALGLPRDYVASGATLNPRAGLRHLLTAISGLDVPLVLLRDPAWNGETLEAALSDTGIDASRVVVATADDPAARAAVLAGARLFAEPSRLEGFGVDALDAMTAGAPLIATDDPALSELAVDAARYVERGDDLADGLRAAIEELLADDAAAARLRVAGQDRARAFSWRDSAERVWQLHADI